MKSCTSASREVSKKIERKIASIDKEKQKVKIIDENECIEVVHTQRTLSASLSPADKTQLPELRIVEVRNQYEVEVAKAKNLIKRVQRNGWKVKGPLTGFSYC